jgi:hypothetical protein
MEDSYVGRSQSAYWQQLRFLQVFFFSWCACLHTLMRCNTHQVTACRETQCKQVLDLSMNSDSWQFQTLCRMHAAWPTAQKFGRARWANRLRPGQEFHRVYYPLLQLLTVPIPDRLTEPMMQTCLTHLTFLAGRAPKVVTGSSDDGILLQKLVGRVSLM